MSSNATKTQHLPDGVQIKQETEFNLNVSSWGSEESTETSFDYNTFDNTINGDGESFATKVQDTLNFKQERLQINEEIDIKLEVPVKEEHKAIEIDPCISALASPSVHSIKSERNMNTPVLRVDGYNDQIHVKEELVPVKKEFSIEINLVQCAPQDIKGQNHVEALDNQIQEVSDANVPANTKRKSQKIKKKITKVKNHETRNSPDDGSSVSTTKKKIRKINNKKYDKKNHICNTCGSAYTHDYYLVRHMTSHTGEKPFACKTCGKKFIQRAHLVQHLRVHTGEKPYACNICENKAFNHKYNYKIHMKKHFGEPSQKCNLCSSVFHQKGDLQRHMRTHTGEKPFACNICNASFGQNCHLTQHLRIHTKEKPFSCNFCELTFAKKKHLNEHITVHTDAELFSCSMEDCSKVFQTKSEFLNHLKYHAQKKPYSCDKCNKTFKSKGPLTTHTVLVHDKKEIADD